MIRQFETDPVDRDDRLGEAIETFLAQAEAGSPPDPDEFVAQYPDLGDDLRAALEGLALVRGLVGDASGPGHRLEAGRRVAGYRIVRELGRGGMGIVYEAVHVDLDRPVALKVLGMHAAPDSTGRRRFLNEARTAAGLHHTHIVPVFDVGQVGGLCYYAMQRIEGCGLDRVLRAMRRGRSTAAGSGAGRTAAATTPQPTAGKIPGPPGLAGPQEETATWLGSGVSVSGHSGGAHGSAGHEPPAFEPPTGSSYYRWVARVGRQAAEALAHAHRSGIIHRDIKPSNLLVDARGTIWVADFGLARRMADPSLTQSDSLLGTPRYMSPEQASNAAIDGRTDIYSLGATLYELLTLRPPFEGRTHAELHKQITGKEPNAPRQYDRRIPRDLETIVLKAMAKRPADRYGSAVELAEDLSRFLSYEPVKARRIGPVGRLWRFAQRHPSITAVSTVAAATVLAVATISYVRIMQERDRVRGALKQAEASNEDARAALRAFQEEARKRVASERNELYSHAEVTRQSLVPNRRDLGLGLLRRAAALDPDPAFRVKLRSEAVNFLALRQVERQEPLIPAGSSRSIVFGSNGTRLATLSEDGTELRLWDVTRAVLRAGPLKTGPDAALEPPGGNRRGDVPPVNRRVSGGIVAVGHQLAVLWPNGRGIRLFDGYTGDLFADLPMPEHEIVGIHAVPGDQPRLVTVERYTLPRRPAGSDAENNTAASRKGGGGPPPDRRGPQPEGFRINLWDPAHAESAIKMLVESPPPEPGQFPIRNPALVAIDPEGQTVATAWSGQPQVSLWSAADGERQGEPIETQAPIYALALGPDGLLATATSGVVHLWETETRSPLGSLNTQVRVNRIRFSPDGSLLVLASWEKGVELWDTAATAMVAALPATERIGDVAFSPTGQALAIAHSSPASDSGQVSSVAVWNIFEPIGEVRFSGFRETPTSLAFAPDGLLAMASWRSALRLWCPDRCPSSSHSWEGISPSSIAFDSDRHLVALEGDTLRWYAPPSKESLRKVALPELRPGGPGLRKGPVRFAAPVVMGRTPDGRKLALARPGDVLLYSADHPDTVQRIAIPGSARPSRDRGRGAFGPPPWREVALSPSGDRVYLCNFDGDVSAWALEGGKLRSLGWSTPHTGVTSLALSPDGRLLALARDGSVLLVSAADGNVVHRLIAPSDEDEGDVRSLVFAPSSRQLAVGSSRGMIRLWKIDGTPEPLVRLPGHRASVNILAYDTTGHRLATGGLDKTVVVWDLERVRTELAKLGLGW